MNVSGGRGTEAARGPLKGDITGHGGRDETHPHGRGTLLASSLWQTVTMCPGTPALFIKILLKVTPPPKKKRQK